MTRIQATILTAIAMLAFVSPAASQAQADSASQSPAKYAVEIGLQAHVGFPTTTANLGAWASTGLLVYTADFGKVNDTRAVTFGVGHKLGHDVTVLFYAGPSYREHEGGSNEWFRGGAGFFWRAIGARVTASRSTVVAEAGLRVGIEL